MKNEQVLYVAPTPRIENMDPAFSSEDGRFVLYQADCLELMPRLAEGTFDMIFADPPYFLSNGGITCHAGRMVSVNKGKWDRSLGFRGNYDFTLKWLAECQRLLKPNGSIWISGTSHIIHVVGCCLDELGYKILNDITWVKKNPPPNLSCRYFTHATETVIWAGRDKRCKVTMPIIRAWKGARRLTGRRWKALLATTAPRTSRSSLPAAWRNPPARWRLPMRQRPPTLTRQSTISPPAPFPVPRLRLPVGEVHFGLEELKGAAGFVLSEKSSYAT